MSAPMSFDDLSKLAATIVGKATGDEAMHQRFMAAAAGNEDGFVTYLTSAEIGMPEDVAKTVAGLDGDELYAYVGKYICGYLW